MLSLQFRNCTYTYKCKPCLPQFELTAAFPMFLQNTSTNAAVIAYGEFFLRSENYKNATARTKPKNLMPLSSGDWWGSHKSSYVTYKFIALFSALSVVACSCLNCAHTGFRRRIDPCDRARLFRNCRNFYRLSLIRSVVTLNSTDLQKALYCMSWSKIIWIRSCILTFACINYWSSSKVTIDNTFNCDFNIILLLK